MSRGACVVRMDNSVYCWGAGGFLSGGGPATMATEQDWCDLCAPSDCTGNTPQCLNGVCGSCTDDSQCPPATPACAPSGACAQCSPDNTSACPATAPACSAQGTCICMQDWDCGDNPVGMACDDATHQCRAGCRGIDGTGCPTGLYCSSTTSAIGTCEMAMPTSGGCQCAAPGGRAGAGGRAARFVPLLALGLLAVFRRRRRSW